MCAEHVKAWLRGALEEEDPESQGNFVGHGDNWKLFIELVQAVWTHGIIPCQMLWSIVVLIPKGGGGTTRGSGCLSQFGRCSSESWIAGSTPLSCTTASMAVAHTAELAPG